jgi:hypothetical protein
MSKIIQKVSSDKIAMVYQKSVFNVKYICPESWTRALLQAAIDCLVKEKKPTTSTDIEQYLTAVYGTLSNEIHGAPWSKNAVELSDQLNPLDKCFLIKLLVRMGFMDDTDPGL